MPPKIAAKIDAVKSFGGDRVEPQVLQHSIVEFMGEINERQKAAVRQRSEAERCRPVDGNSNGIR